MRWFAILACIFMAGASAAAEERPILQLDTGGHMSRIKSVVFAPGGDLLASAGDDKVIRIWNWQSGKTVRIIRGEIRPGNEGQIFAVSLSADGRWLAVGGWITIPDQPGHYIRLHEFNSGRLVTLLKGHANIVTSLAFSPNGGKLISGSSDNTAIIWSTENGQPLHRLLGHSALTAVGFTPDGERVVTASTDKTLRLWRVGDGGEIAVLDGHKSRVRAVAISPADGSIASGSDDGEIRLWDGTTGRFLRTLANQGAHVGSLSFDPTGNLLVSTCASYCDGYVQRVWEVATGIQRAVYTKHDETVVVASAVSPNGDLAATGDSPGQVHIWNVKTGQPIGVLRGSGERVPYAGFSRDGRRIVWGNTFKSAWKANDWGDPSFQLQLPTTVQKLGRPEPLSAEEAKAVAGPQVNHHSWSLTHAPGGTHGYSNATLEIRKDGKIERRITLEGNAHNSYSFTPDGQSIISGGGNGWLAAYDRAGNKLGDFVGHEGDVWAAVPSPDGRFLVSGASDQTVRLWNLKTRELIVSLFNGNDGEWVMWTPEGFYTGSPGADNIVSWQINQGPDKEARYVTAGQLRKALHRPDLVAAKIAGDPEGLVKEAAAKLNIAKLISESLAPQVAILSPQNGAYGREFSEGGSTRVRITVAARITDGGGGIGRISFKLNGQAIGTAYGALMLDRDGIISRNFDLATPDTAIEIVAEDKDGKVESLPASVTVQADAKALQGVPDLYVLAIAANRYRDLSKKLNFAVPDASELAGALKAAGAGFYRHEPIVKTLFDGEVTPEAVKAAFEELAGKVQATDVFVLYVAGHGKTVDADYYFLPPSMDGFSDAAIKAQGFGPNTIPRWLENIQAQKTILIFDTCESGSAGKSYVLRDAAADDAAYKRLKEATGRTMFMASEAQQSAIEGYRNHGVFTYALLEGLAKAGSGEKVQLFDLADYVENRVPELSRALNACEAKGPGEYCQKPKVPIGSANFPIVPRYPAILAKLGADAPQISRKPTHALLAAADLFESAGRGGAVKRQLKRGEQVTLIKAEGGWAYIAKDGSPLGYVKEDKLLPLSE